MSNAANLTAKISELSRTLTQTTDEDEIEAIECEIAELQNELDEMFADEYADNSGKGYR